MPYPKGQKWTEEQRASIRGRKTWNKGISRTLEERQAISAGISLDSRQQSSLIMKERWKDGVYKGMFGETNPSKRPEVAEKIGRANCGRVVSEITRRKISASNKGRPGHPGSEVARLKTSIRMLNNNPMCNPDVIAKHPVLREGSTFYSAGEQAVATILTRMGASFIHQRRFPKPLSRGYYVDFYLPNHKVAIEYDGHQSHYTKEGKAKDRARDTFLFVKYAVRTFRIRRKAIYQQDDKALIKAIQGFLNNDDPVGYN